MLESSMAEIDTLNETLFQLPKAELHVHLDGSVRFETVIELASESTLPEFNVDVPELRLRLDASKAGSLPHYLSAFQYTIPLMQTAQVLRRIAYEYVKDVAAEHVVQSEVRFCPVLHTQKGLSCEEVVEAVVDGLSAADRDFSTRTGLLVCALRHHAVDEGIKLAKLAAHYKGRGVVGFDLAGPEAQFPATLHLEACKIAKRAGLGLTIHAGEAAGPESIEQAVFDCGADRIGHGCRLIDDLVLLERLRRHNVTLECCPSSNVHTGAVASLDVHPLRQLAQAGVRVTINTDNRLMSNTTLTQEFTHCAKKMGLTWREAQSFSDNAFSAAFF